MGDAVSVPSDVCAVRIVPTWKSVRVGVHKTAEAVRSALARTGNRLTQYGAGMVEKVYEVGGIEEEEVEFVCVSNADLGLSRDASLEEIRNAGFRLGFMPCKSWDAFALRETYQDQPRDTWLLVVMDVVDAHFRHPQVFTIDCTEDGRKLLDGLYDTKEGRFSSKARMVFRRGATSIGS